VPGRYGNVSRIVSAVALTALLVAGCGGSSRPPDRTAVHGVPRALASEWEARAVEVANAAAAGDSCRASQLAASLRDEVIANQSHVPSRLQSPLLAGVNALADRIVCRPPTNTVTAPPASPPEHKPHDDHGKHHKHGGENQGNEG
jgi:hypothetical protein